VGVIAAGVGVVAVAAALVTRSLAGTSAIVPLALLVAVVVCSLDPSALALAPLVEG
jgi:hypothetical protein